MMCSLHVKPESRDDADLAVMSPCNGQQLCKRFNGQAWRSKEGAAIIGPFGKVSKVLYFLLLLFNHTVSHPHRYFAAPDLESKRK